MAGKPLESRLAERAKKNAIERPKPHAYNLNDSGEKSIKLLLYGHSGSGKTFFLVGLLLAGEKVYVLSSDFGDNGLITVENELRRLGRAELIQNVRVINVSEYEQIAEFLVDPLVYDSEIVTFDPTVFVWEGFSTYNVDILDEYILSKLPGAKDSGELRYEGFTHTQQDWQGMKRGTLRPYRRFLAFTLPNGKRMHKIMTALESQPVLDQLTQKVDRTLLVQGSGRALMGPGFDAIIECAKEEKVNKETKELEVEHFYRCNGSTDKVLVKSRGFDLKPREEGNPERIWRILRGEKV